ncbi:MAG TPA: hypothetical protein VID03_09520 [Acidimicrobiia bacterium]
MNVYVVVLRLVHILAGVFWIGGALMVSWFLLPAVQAAGPAGGSVMQKFAVDRRAPTWLTAAAGLTVLAGLLLFWEVSGHLEGTWLSSPQGMTISIGAAFGIVAAVLGIAIGAPTTKRVVALGGAIAAGGQPPSPEQAARLGALQRRSAGTIRWVSILGAVAVACMAVAEYV